MHNEKYIYPTSINDCCAPTRSVDRLIKVSKVLYIIQMVSVVLLGVSTFITSIALTAETEEAWVFFVTILAGATITGLIYLIFFLTILIIDAITSLVYSSNTSTKLKIYELSKNEKNISKPIIKQEPKKVNHTFDITWTCLVCNKENSKYEMYCTHCGTSKNGEKTTKPITSQLPEKEESVVSKVEEKTKVEDDYKMNSTWTCKICNEINPHHEMYCIHCGASKNHKEEKKDVQPSTTNVKPMIGVRTSGSYRTWKCNCGTENSKFDMFCSGCGEMRG